MGAEAPRRISGTALMVAGGLLLSGCAVIGGGGVIPSDGPLAVHPRPEAGMDALLEGTLVLEDGCLTVAHAEAGVVVPTFPAGDATYADGVLTWRDEEYRSGDAIALGGGFTGTASYPSTDGYMPQECVGLEVFVVSPFQ